MSVCVYVHVFMCGCQREKEEKELLLSSLSSPDCKCVMSRDQNYNNNTYIL